jgi:hypothetical protein
VKRGDNRDKRNTLVPPYLKIGEHNLPLDVASFLVGLVLIFFSHQIASYFQASISDVTRVGEILLTAAAFLFIFGRIELKK